MATLLLLVGVALCGYALWEIVRRPRWVIGADRLQYVVGRSGVRLEIPYENLAAVELCRPSQWVGRPFVGLRLVNPGRLDEGVAPAAAREVHERFGYHWGIRDVEIGVPLKRVTERITERFRAWQSTRSGPPAP